MARIIVLDSSPVGLGCKEPTLSEPALFWGWVTRMAASGATVVLPEIADYEVRRKLLHLRAFRSLSRLDAMGMKLKYDPITRLVMRKAAELWADARRRGQPTSGPRALDADSILAAQALLLAGAGDVVTVATENVGHLGQFVDGRPWASIA